MVRDAFVETRDRSSPFVVVRCSIILAPEPRGPITDSSDGIVAQAPRTRVLPADQAARLHLGATDKLLALQRMGEVALVQALDIAVAMQNHFHLGDKRERINDLWPIFCTLRVVERKIQFLFKTNIFLSAY